MLTIKDIHTFTIKQLLVAATIIALLFVLAVKLLPVQVMQSICRFIVGVSCIGYTWRLILFCKEILISSDNDNAKFVDDNQSIQRSINKWVFILTILAITGSLFLFFSATSKDLIFIILAALSLFVFVCHWWYKESDWIRQSTNSDTHRTLTFSLWIVSIYYIILHFGTPMYREIMADRVIDSYFKERLYFYESYKAIDTEVFEAYESTMNDPHLWKIAEQIYDLKNYANKYNSLSKEQKRDSSIIVEAEETIHKIQQLTKDFARRNKKLNASKKIGYIVNHEYKAKSASGNMSKYSRRFIINLELDKIILDQDRDEIFSFINELVYDKYDPYSDFKFINKPLN